MKRISKSIIAGIESIPPSLDIFKEYHGKIHIPEDIMEPEIEEWEIENLHVLKQAHPG